MIIKLILLAVVIYIVYTLFFKEGNLITKMKENASKNPKKKSEEKDVDTVVECQKCGVYVSVDEAILKDGKYYCSKECAEVK